MQRLVPQAWLPLATLLLLGVLPPMAVRAGSGGAALLCRVTFVDSPDSDGDDLLDTTEDWMGTDPHRADTDGDGMPDGWEVANRLSPLLTVGDDGGAGDPDGDSVGNFREYVADTNPHDSNSVLRFITIARHGDMTRLLWQGGVNSWQYLETSVNLNAPHSWQPLTVVAPPTPSFLMAYDPSATNAVRFYRIRTTREAP